MTGLIQTLIPRGSAAFDAPRNSRRVGLQNQPGAFSFGPAAMNSAGGRPCLDFNGDAKALACVALITICQRMEGRRPSLSEIARRLNLSKTAVSRAVDRAIRAGELQRAHHAPGIQISQQHQAQPQP